MSISKVPGMDPWSIIQFVGGVLTVADVTSRVYSYSQPYFAPTAGGGSEPVPTPPLPIANVTKPELEVLMNATALNGTTPEDFSLSDMTALLSSVKQNITASDAWKEAAVGAQGIWDLSYELIAGGAAAVNKGIGEALPPIVSGGWNLTAPSLKIGGGLLLGFVLLCKWRSTRPVEVKQNVTVLSEPKRGTMPLSKPALDALARARYYGA